MSASEEEWMSLYPQGRVSGHLYTDNDPTSYHAIDADTQFSDEAYLFMQIEQVPDYLEGHLQAVELGGMP